MLFDLWVSSCGPGVFPVSIREVFNGFLYLPLLCLSGLACCSAVSACWLEVDSGQRGRWHCSLFFHSWPWCRIEALKPNISTVWKIILACLSCLYFFLWLSSTFHYGSLKKASWHRKSIEEQQKHLNVIVHYVDWIHTGQRKKGNFTHSCYFIQFRQVRLSVVMLCKY